MNPKPQHTPTPWHHNHKATEGDPRHEFIIVDNAGRLIADCYSTVKTDEQCEANAAHIANCVNLMPKCAELLETLLDTFSEYYESNKDIHFNIEFQSMQKLLNKIKETQNEQN